MIKNARPFRNAQEKLLAALEFSNKYDSRTPSRDKVIESIKR
jgi:hypothetical protein